ncbi:hypothetical protein BDZ94DRAFT_1310617 [Collybia nuda]|uniref:Uncharacterized protein n=1 Tax=Collybia nuda TaxID=64659 RepID=A0A9P5Y272_9AGAR|nr:hypothetical protein BDZ94DRAFT_1310617 [Collybia nuda]
MHGPSLVTPQDRHVQPCESSHAPPDAPAAGDGMHSSALLAPPSHIQPLAPSRAPSKAPSATSHTSSRAPSAPPRVPSAMSVAGPWLPSGHPSTHPYPPNPYAYPQMQHPPPPSRNPRSRGATRPNGHGHPPYIRAGPGGRGQGGPPQPKDGHETVTYYEGYPPPRPIYNGDGYYGEYGYAEGYEGDPSDPGHYPPYANPYGYWRPQPYPPYPGPSHYPGRHNALDYPMAYADDDGSTESSAMQGMIHEGWSEVQGGGNPADTK